MGGPDRRKAPSTPLRTPDPYKTSRPLPSQGGAICRDRGRGGCGVGGSCYAAPILGRGSVRSLSGIDPCGRPLSLTLFEQSTNCNKELWRPYLYKGMTRPFPRSCNRGERHMACVSASLPAREEVECPE